MAHIDSFRFQLNTVGDIRNLTHGDNKVGDNWPVVYVINNDKKAYVGETVNAARRAEQHLANPEKKKLTEIRIISDDEFNKSVILDLESYLIKHISADGKYKLLNGNNGLQDHDYYDRKRYEKEFKDIWEELKSQGIVDQSIEDIENSELFKYSPYKTLGDDQIEAEQDILRAFAEHRHDADGVRIVVEGAAGTGKTILAIYLMKTIADAANKPDDRTEIQDYIDEDTESVYAADSMNGINKIGIVLPQPSLRGSIKDVFKSIDSLKASMVMGPSDVVNEYLRSGRQQFDLLIVDEGHRLKSRKSGNMANNGSFKNKCLALGIDYETGSELDWLCVCSKHLIIFRDADQTVRPCDMDTEEFDSTLKKNWNGQLVRQFLLSQWRCQGGNDYVNYIKGILRGKVSEFRKIDNYDFKLYDDVDRMISDIKALNVAHGLCRNAAGFAWPWLTKGMDPYQTDVYDIEIGDYKYKWNHTQDNWIGADNSVNEIGCIHTVQGYDLNYLGLIIGEDIKYDEEKKEIVAVSENYYDSMGKATIADDPETLRDYLINIYITLMTRGIYGTYVYVCDPDLREYMSQFIEKA